MASDKKPYFMMYRKGSDDWVPESMPIAGELDQSNDRPSNFFIQRWSTPTQEFNVFRTAYSKVGATRWMQKRPNSLQGMMEGPDLFIVTKKDSVTGYRQPAPIITVWKPFLVHVEILHQDRRHTVLPKTVNNEKIFDVIWDYLSRDYPGLERKMEPEPNFVLKNWTMDE